MSDNFSSNFLFDKRKTNVKSRAKDLLNSYRFSQRLSKLFKAFLVYFSVYLMLVLTNVLVPNENNNRQNSLPTVRISLNEFVEKHVDQPFQSTFNRHARLPSMLSNIALWFILILTVALFHKEKDHFSFKARLTIGLVILMIIIISYVFILFESNGCIEQILLKKRLQIDLIKRELAFMKKNSKLNSCLLVSATNYFNSLRRKFIDYKVGKKFD